MSTRHRNPKEQPQSNSEIGGASDNAHQSKKRNWIGIISAAALGALVLVVLITSHRSKPPILNGSPEARIQKSRLANIAPQGMNGAAPSPQMFINKDGSVDESKVKELKNAIPSAMRGQALQMMKSQIGSAVSAGEITQTQADAIISIITNN